MIRRNHTRRIGKERDRHPRRWGEGQRENVNEVAKSGGSRREDTQVRVEMETRCLADVTLNPPATLAPRGSKRGRELYVQFVSSITFQLSYINRFKTKDRGL